LLDPPEDIMTTDAPLLDGVHHLKLPVSDLDRARGWYESRLGYQVTTEFVEHGRVTGLVMTHPNGGPMFGLRLDPQRAKAAAGFDYFSIGVPTKEALDALAERLTGLGETHAGVHFATIGWILPDTHDPDGHEVRFYTTQHHTDADDAEIQRVDDAKATAARREQSRTAADSSD
jgi:catechol 2,3-dioxygenase-like lactoylglutathione lyase family enzyme